MGIQRSSVFLSLPAFIYPSLLLLRVSHPTLTLLLLKKSITFLAALVSLCVLLLLLLPPAPGAAIEWRFELLCPCPLELELEWTRLESFLFIWASFAGSKTFLVLDFGFAVACEVEEIVVVTVSLLLVSFDNGVGAVEFVAWVEKLDPSFVVGNDTFELEEWYEL